MLLPEPAFAELKPLLDERLQRVRDRLHFEQFSSLFDPLMRQVLERGFADAEADEGTLWLLDEGQENLVPAFNNGPNSRELVGKFKQPLTAGLVCMVFASEQPFLENDVWKNPAQSKQLDALLRTQTQTMIAVPFYILRACRGVISCVRLKGSGSEGRTGQGFQPNHLVSVERAGALLSELLDFRLLSQTVGWV
jgi:hypothetical protein